MASAVWKVLVDGEIRLASGSPEGGPSELLAAGDLDPLIAAGAAAIRAALDGTVGPVPPGYRVLAPIGSQPVWASGVTYERSRAARNAESDVPDVYDKVYVAERPELFLKAPPGGSRGPGETVGIRADSTWDVPEPELTLAVDATGTIAALTCGNDMSSRSIEGENPLYLPQAKVYDLSCAVGPCLLPAGEVAIADLEIRLVIERGGATAFDEAISGSAIHRDVADLATWLFRANTFPTGAFLMTGTGIVPPEDFTLAAGDVVTVAISGIGSLTNPVVEVGAR
ncbi:fumarylacetoacetate hydrolase family protein [Microlunatus ginsengisoli]|uniref:Fumarylacetoacetate hydrolase family protein n=1 Tax=Microlunatus ginsengisoli TaxID=363863 RepID=A0ABP7AXY4_9ACTN